MIGAVMFKLSGNVVVLKVKIYQGKQIKKTAGGEAYLIPPISENIALRSFGFKIR